MIKKLSLKFVLVFLVLVVSVIITSSCYASETFIYKDIFNIVVDENAKTITIENTALGTSNVFDCSYGFSNYSQYYIMGRVHSSYPNETNFYVLFSNSFSWNSNDYLPNDFGYVNLDDLYLYNIKTTDNNSGINGIKLQQTVSSSAGTAGGAFVTYGLIVDSNDNIVPSEHSSNHTLIYSNHTIYAHNNTDLVLYKSRVDTSFNYSIEGVKRGQTKLKITNLDSSLRMYGYVGFKNNFNVGDTLDTSSISSYLRLLSMYSDNSDLDCYLYDGEELLYYIVDEDNVILDIGYISEMAKGNFLYGFNVYNGVDFVFLRDGQVYWDNDLTFKYSIGSSSKYEKNDIVSMGQSSYIVTDKTVASNTYKGYVYDIDGTLIAEASANSSNDLSSISISVDTNYYETNVGWNKSCYWLMSFDLDGTNVDGSFIDFSNYYAKWSIPTWINLDSIEVSGEEYTKRNGIFNGFSSAGYSGMVNLKIFELIKNHISNFDIKLEIYDSDDNLVLTHLINSDDIVKNQVAKEENNVDKGDYDILDNPNYTGGSSSSPNINNIQDWTADDYVNLIGTDNFVWEFFKAILGNLPWWITTPLTILIFGVVIITLIRFARGA